MSAPEVKGWCPGALRPMMSGDGLVVRVRPMLARLTRAQMLGLCQAATRYGAGLIDLTSRANLQLRGVAEASLPALQTALAGLGLLDRDESTEARRNVLVAPDWRAGDDTHRLALALTARLADLPPLPAKVGFAIDAGAAPVLRDTPADFRIERGAAGGLILRAEGRAWGRALPPGGEIDALIALAHWFVATGGAQAGRMARHAAPLPEPDAPAPPRPALEPGPCSAGLAVGFAFGQIAAPALATLVARSGAQGVRITPWRIAVLEGVRWLPAALPAGVLADPEAPALRVDACAGAPYCPQAQAETRALALRLAGHVPGRLHVSGCAKGCARAGPADVTLTATAPHRFDLARRARAGAPPDLPAQSPAQLLAHFGAS
ncbi:cobalamin biosynthesis protein CobG [Roseovarius autotrophicus]|uniref:cobalamin biosynthesis protein CobG n=1 Tax=Roseovarius autotrophicus TaxID=2824121 RepID=UPI0019F96528|nr:cobalamin biosynthesis protein CobG [Roseovarius autotrophicus]MBE0453095.1 cobalamin biosynthesis protein CobG [Roseovarius sp.]